MPRRASGPGVCSCLGLPCPKFPSDTNVVSKLAVAIYTTKGGKVEDLLQGLPVVARS